MNEFYFTEFYNHKYGMSMQYVEGSMNKKYFIDYGFTYKWERRNNTVMNGVFFTDVYMKYNMAYVRYVQFALALAAPDLLDHNMEFFTAMRGSARDEAPIRQRSLHDVSHPYIHWPFAETVTPGVHYMCNLL